MHAYISEVFSHLDASREALRHAMARIPEPLRRRRPAPDRWSPVEIVEHLALVETRFSAVVGAKIADAVSSGLGPETGPREPLPVPTATLLSDRDHRRTAPDPAQPTGTLSEGDAWAAADKARADFRRCVMRGDGRALRSVVHAHPFFGPLDVYQWVELIAAHEMRHVAQVREAAGALVGQGA